MTRTVFLLILLYLIWRIATWVGRRQRREYLRREEGRGALLLVRCDRCGSYVSPADVREEGRWPARRLVCAAGCGGDEGGSGSPAGAAKVQR